MKCSQDAALQAAAILTAAKISNGLAEAGAGSGPDVGQTFRHVDPGRAGRHQRVQPLRAGEGAEHLGRDLPMIAGLLQTRLHILSDLHLGSGAMTHPRTDADVVVLAGDIARPREAVAWALGFAQPVLYVPGNHEFYGGSLDGTLAELRALAAGTHVHVLADDELVVEGVRFLGATLWTDFDLFGKGERRDRRRSRRQACGCATSAASGGRPAPRRCTRRKTRRACSSATRPGCARAWPRRTPARRWW